MSKKIPCCLKLLTCLSMLALHAYAEDNVLVVGTPGDYPPLSKMIESNFVGRDIDLMNKFAKDNGLVIRFVKTSWQTLADDLQANKFSIAVGGISYTPKRADMFYLSSPIESSSKVAMIRCNDITKYSSFADIDQESVTVVENRGGTNQDFAITHIKNAHLLLVKQNEEAINSLTKSQYGVNVMFTDNTEVEYRHSVNPELCQASLIESFPTSPKVFLFSKNKRGAELVHTFNDWLTNNH